MSESQAPAGARPPQLFCGDIDIRIAGDGTWFHEGCPIGRLPLVKLFASVLRREDDDYWLVTPVEKARIAVDDVPFIAVEMEAEGDGEAQCLRFRTNLDEWVSAGAAHPLAFRSLPGSDEKRPTSPSRRPGGPGGALGLLSAGGALRRAGDRGPPGARRLERRRVLPLRRRRVSRAPCMPTSCAAWRGRRRAHRISRGTR